MRFFRFTVYNHAHKDISRSKRLCFTFFRTVLELLRPMFSVVTFFCLDYEFFRQKNTIFVLSSYFSYTSVTKRLMLSRKNWSPLIHRPAVVSLESNPFFFSRTKISRIIFCLATSNHGND